MLKYNQTVPSSALNASNAHQVFSPAGAQKEKTSPLIYSLGVILYYWKSIFLTALGLFLAFLILLIFIPTRYVSVAQLYIDPKGIQIFDNDLSNSKNIDSLSSMTIVESQTKILTSLSVLKQVVENNNLTKDEEFYTPKESNKIISGIKNLLHLNVDKAWVNSPESIAASELFSKTTIKRAERTFIVDISMKTSDAVKSATLANAIAQSFLDVQNQNRTENARKTTSFLTSRLDELREKVKISEDKAESFKAKNNLLGTRGTTVSEQQLSDANYQLSTARSRLADAQSRYEQIQQAKKSGDISGITEAINSQTISSIRSAQTDAKRKLSELSLELGTRHPHVQNIKAQIDDLSKTINEELNRIAEAMKNDLERAKSADRLATQNVEKLKEQAIDNNSATVQLRELEREVEASRQLYNTFLLRSRETSETENLDTSNTRIISQATPALKRSFPPANLILFPILLILAGLLALMQAFARSFINSLRVSH